MHPQFALEPSDPRQPPERHTPVPEDPARQRDEISDEHRHLGFTDDHMAEIERQGGPFHDSPVTGSGGNHAQASRPADPDEDISVDRDDAASDNPLGTREGTQTERELDRTHNPRESPGPGAEPQGYPGGR